jgi:hypothetical protein
VEFIFSDDSIGLKKATTEALAGVFLAALTSSGTLSIMYAAQGR